METVKEKQKRVLSPEALAKLQIARKLALEAKRKNKTITDFKKEEKKEAREAEYQKVIDAKRNKDQKLPPLPQPPEDSSSEEEDKLPKPIPQPPKKPSHKKKLPPPKEPELSSEEEEEIPEPIPEKPKKKPIVSSEQQLYSKANIEMLRNRLYQQTRQRLKNDMFSY